MTSRSRISAVGKLGDIQTEDLCCCKRQLFRLGTAHTLPVNHVMGKATVWLQCMFILPAHTLPAHTLPAHTFPAHTLPVHTLPAHTFPAHTLPAHTLPVNHVIGKATVWL